MNRIFVEVYREDHQKAGRPVESPEPDAESVVAYEGTESELLDIAEQCDQEAARVVGQELASARRRLFLNATANTLRAAAHPAGAFAPAHVAARHRFRRRLERVAGRAAILVLAFLAIGALVPIMLGGGVAGFFAWAILLGAGLLAVVLFRP